MARTFANAARLSLPYSSKVVPTHRSVRLSRRAASGTAITCQAADFTRVPAHPVSATSPHNHKDHQEQEADHIAETVTNLQEPAVQRQCGCGGGFGEGGECQACKGTHQDTLRRDAISDQTFPDVPSIVSDVVRSPGQPLDGVTRDFMETRFGRDFSHVRVHTDSKAEKSALAMGARAYTLGNRIVFGRGNYAPMSGEGNRLLAHELTHVVQQSRQTHRVLQRQTFGGPLDMKFDPCITVPGLGELCGQAAADACKKMPLPGCGIVCKAFDCSKPEEPSTVCPPGWRAATSTDFQGQCCLGSTDSAENCCYPHRVAMVDQRCCKSNEAVVDHRCRKSDDVPHDLPCPSGQRTLLGECCLPPKVSKGLQCGLPDVNPPKPPPTPTPTMLGVLWTDEIHFQKDHPAPGESDRARVLTEDGANELDSMLSWLNLSPSLQVRLIGHTSSEGPENYNQALATRRANFVAAAIAGRGFAARVADPIISDGAESGCQQVRAGIWSCGKSKADPITARPEDRVVRVTFARNTLPPLTPLAPPWNPTP